MENNEMETVKEVVDRMQATYKSLGEPVTLVIGCGGAGNNFVDYFHRLDVEGITTIGINTDEQHLTQIEAHKKVFIGKTITRGKGAGGHSEIGEKAAEIAVDILKDLVKNSDIVFLVAGLGGGTGLGATPVVGRLAKEQGAVVIGIGILPFSAEVHRRKKADLGSAELKKIAESTILLDNNKLLKIAPGLSTEESLNIMNRMISQVIISTRNTMVQTKSTTEALDVSDILGQVSTGAIEEKKPRIDAGSDIVLPMPLHAKTLPKVMEDPPGSNSLENRIVDNFQ